MTPAETKNFWAELYRLRAAVGEMQRRQWLLIGIIIGSEVLRWGTVLAG